MIMANNRQHEFPIRVLMVTIALSSLLTCWRREFFKVKAV